MTKYENDKVDLDLTETWEITGSESIAGYPTKVQRNTVRDEHGAQLYREWFNFDLTAAYLREIGWRDDESVEQVRDNNPTEDVPVWVSTSASNLHFGHGLYRTWETAQPAVKWDGLDDEYITYLGRETITVPGGTFTCTKVRDHGEWEDNGGDEGTETYTTWFHEDIGVVRAECVDREWVWDEGEWFETVYTQELKSWRPLPPTGVSASDGTYTDRVRVTWDAVAGATSYEVWRNNSDSSAAATRIASSVAGTAYDDTTVVPGTTYWYWVKATSAHGTSAFSDSDSGRADPGGQPPEPPENVQATDGTYPDKVRVTWNASVGATSYEVWRNLVDNLTGATRIASSVTATTYDDTTAAAVGTVYYYWVKAVNAHGTSAALPGDPGHRCTTPIPPTGVQATDGTYADKVRLTWNATAGATSYEVWRYISDNATPATRIATITATQHDDTTAQLGTTYWYWVKAKNAAGTSGWSQSDSGHRQPATVVCVDDSNATGVEDGSAQHPFNTVQEGVNAVADAGTVKVARGTYTGNVTIDGKRVTIKGGYLGGTYPGTGNFNDGNRNPDPSTNNTVIVGGGAAVLVRCQGAGSSASELNGFKTRSSGAAFRGGVVLKRVIALD